MPPAEAPRTLEARPLLLRLSQERRDRTFGIFISYRRKDSPAHAGRIYDGLSKHFGESRVFFDVDAIGLGTPYMDEIEESLSSAEAVLVVLGPGWLSAMDKAGLRRLDDPQDVLRVEVATALRRAPLVIPVLVGGTALPDKEELPPDLTKLAGLHALRLTDGADWRFGMTRLIAELEEKIPEPPQPVPVEDEAELIEVEEDEEGDERREEHLSIAWLIFALAGAALLVAGTLLQVDFWAHPEGRGGRDRDGLGYLSSLAPMGLAVGAAASLLLSYSRRAARIGTGLVLGFALAGVARHVGLLGLWDQTAGNQPSSWVTGAVLALIGCLLLAAVAIRRIAADREERAAPGKTGVLPGLLVMVGAGLVVAGTIVPFNNAPKVEFQSLIEREAGWGAFEAIAIAVFAVAVLLFLSRGREVASGALIALGTFATLLWAGRYLGFPVWLPNEFGSPGPGAFLGLGGAVAILAGGLLARPRRAHASVPSGLPAGGAT